MTASARPTASPKRLLLIGAIAVLVVDVVAIVASGGAGLVGFPGEVIRRALEPIVPRPMTVTRPLKSSEKTDRAKSSSICTLASASNSVA